jgi:AraC family transcriptional regulator
MNAPYPPVLLKGEVSRHPRAVEPWTILPQAVRMSSLPLGWRFLNIERRELEPGAHSLPGGTTHHLIFVSLAEGHCTRTDDHQSSTANLEAGHVSIHPAYKPVRWDWDTRLSFTTLCLEPAFLENVAEEIFDLPADELLLKTIQGQRDPEITHFAGLLTREVLSGDRASQLLADSVAMQLAIHLLRHYLDRPRPVVSDQAGLPPRAVILASEFIHDNYSRDISLADIARAAHLSAFHLARLFKKSTGVTPYQYLLDVRVQSARSLLSAGAGSRSLADIANAVGFADQSHLTRHFKRVLGMTPKQLRQ